MVRGCLFSPLFLFCSTGLLGGFERLACWCKCFLFLFYLRFVFLILLCGLGFFRLIFFFLALYHSIYLSIYIYMLRLFLSARSSFCDLLELCMSLFCPFNVSLRVSGAGEGLGDLYLLD